MTCCPIEKVSVYPDYRNGFTFAWDMNGGFNDRGPWSFTVQVAPAPDGPWESISGRLDNIFVWTCEGRVLVNKSAILYFRVALETPDGSYVSQVVSPYGDLGRREFLLARDMMRREVLAMRTLSGTLNDVYIISAFGPKCTHCLDPITGHVRDSHCKYCLGTGRDPAYHGPYKLWMSFSQDAAHSSEHGADGGTTEDKKFQVRSICAPILKKNDVIIDTVTDRRYYINSVAIAAEIRRIPIAQNLTVSEAVKSDQIYFL